MIRVFPVGTTSGPSSQENRRIIYPIGYLKFKKDTPISFPDTKGPEFSNHQLRRLERFFAVLGLFKTRKKHSPFLPHAVYEFPTLPSPPPTDKNN